MFEKLYLKKMLKNYGVDINDYYEVVYLKSVLQSMIDTLSSSILEVENKSTLLKERFDYFSNTGKVFNMSYLDEDLKTNKTLLKLLSKENKKRKRELRALNYSIKNR